LLPQGLSAPSAALCARGFAGRAPGLKAEPLASPSSEPPELREPQKASVISEADCRTENPALIGLISMITGYTNLEDIQITYQRLHSRGLEILSQKKDPSATNSPIIKLFKAIDEEQLHSG